MRRVGRWLVGFALVAGCRFEGRHVAGDPDAPGDDAADGPDGAPRACDFVGVAAGTDHTCARTTAGDVWCWGKNSQGQIGTPVQGACATACNVTPTKLALPAVRGLGLGDQHSCAVTATETYCWGADDSGQFGDAGSDSPVPLLITQRAGASAISGGALHTCSIHGGRVKCSGHNMHAEVGDGTTTERLTPVDNSVQSASVVASGLEHACAITGGFAYCWGRNDGAQIAGAIGGDALVPTIVPNLLGDPVSIAGGAKHTCAALASGEVRCWGKNDNGQQGVGDTAAHLGIQTAQVAGIVEVAAGDDHTCARASGGTVYCWGTLMVNYLTPTAIVLPHPAIAITAGHDHSCAVLDDGTVWCWGADGFGQLGDGLQTSNTGLTPVQADVCH